MSSECEEVKGQWTYLKGNLTNFRHGWTINSNATFMTDHREEKKLPWDAQIVFKTFLQNFFLNPVSWWKEKTWNKSNNIWQDDNLYLLIMNAEYKVFAIRHIDCIIIHRLSWPFDSPHSLFSDVVRLLSLTAGVSNEWVSHTSEWQSQKTVWIALKGPKQSSFSIRDTVIISWALCFCINHYPCMRCIHCG